MRKFAFTIFAGATFLMSYGQSIVLNSSTPPGVIDAGGQVVQFTNSTLWYYGIVGESMNFNGRMTFENCDFGASVWASPYITHIDNGNSQLTIKKTQ